MHLQHARYELENGVALVTLNRPETV